MFEARSIAKSLVDQAGSSSSQRSAARMLVFAIYFVAQEGRGVFDQE